MIELERKIKTIIISAVLVLAILSGIAAYAYANGTNNSNATSYLANEYGGYNNSSAPFFERHGRGWGCGLNGPVTVSQEYINNVINIAKNDSDVQNLLANGYNITGVRPIISSTVQADGTVVTKATTAIVMLSQNTTGRALVTVNVEEAKVTRIVILTRTVIEKP